MENYSLFTKVLILLFVSDLVLLVRLVDPLSSSLSDNSTLKGSLIPEKCNFHIQNGGVLYLKVRYQLYFRWWNWQQDKRIFYIRIRYVCRVLEFLLCKWFSIRIQSPPNPIRSYSSVYCLKWPQLLRTKRWLLLIAPLIFVGIWSIKREPISSWKLSMIFWVNTESLHRNVQLTKMSNIILRILRWMRIWCRISFLWWRVAMCSRSRILRKRGGNIFHWSLRKFMEEFMLCRRRIFGFFFE